MTNMELELGKTYKISNSGMADIIVKVAHVNVYPPDIGGEPDYYLQILNKDAIEAANGTEMETYGDNMIQVSQSWLDKCGTITPVTDNEDMQFESAYINFLTTMLESCNNPEAKMAVTEAGNEFISMLEARGGKYNPEFVYHSGEGGREGTAHGERVKSYGKKADDMLEYALKSIDYNSPEARKLEGKARLDFIRDYGVRIAPERNKDGKVVGATFVDDTFINSDGVIYTKTADNEIHPIGDAQHRDLPSREGEVEFHEKGEQLTDELMNSYTKLRDDAWNESNKWLTNPKNGFYKTQAKFGYSDGSHDASDRFELGLASDNAQPVATNKTVATSFNKRHSGESSGDGEAPERRESTPSNTSTFLGTDLLYEGDAFGKLIENVPGLSDTNLDTVLKIINDGTGNSTMVSTVDKAREYLFKLTSPSRVSGVKRVFDKIKNPDNTHLASDIGTALDIINELFLDNAINKRGDTYGIQSAQSMFNKLIPPIGEYTGNPDLLSRGRSVEAVRKNLISFIDNFTGNGEMKNNKFTDTSALIPSLYNKLTDISQKAINKARNYA